MSTKELPTPSGNIKECLTQMLLDAAEIEKRLLEAPVHLTGVKEPILYDIIRGIKNSLERADRVWSDEYDPTQQAPS